LESTVMSAPGSKSSRTTQATSLMVGIALLWGVLATSGHSRYIQHAVCGDHGELIHVRLGGSDEGTTTPHVIKRKRATGGEEHEHCGLHAASRETLVSELASTSHVLPAAAISATIPVSSRRACGADAYRLAPKNSPPSA